MSRNTSYLLGIWFAVGLFLFVIVGWFACVVISAFSQGQGRSAAIFLIVIVISAALGILIYRYQARRIYRLLQSPSADTLIAHLERTIRPGLFMPNADLLLAQGCANIYVLYGDFADARAELDSVDWEDRPPMFTGLRKSAEALLCYLDTRQYERGLALARSALELAEVPSAFPGATKSLAALSSFVCIGEVLTDRFGPSTIEELEDNFRLLPVTAKLLIAWALVQAYRKSGDLGKAKEMQEFIRTVGPHCRALHLPEHSTKT